ncbi:DUF2290 domain-containing protein [Micromonospora aurantiaca]|nr:DUF2290 domain-containing protein [Micromonospora aurantiaca]
MASSAGPHAKIVEEINDITIFLVEVGLANDQNFAFWSDGPNSTKTVNFANMPPFAPMLKARPYSEMYFEQRESRAYNVRMLDGALIQMVYEFRHDNLERYRLAFLPAPDLQSFQNDPDVYNEDILFADVMDPRVVTVPLRFDFDARDGVSENLVHPKSHLTLGQYKSCRIAATAPLTPFLFAEFVLRSFYNTALEVVSRDLPAGSLRMEKCITAEEEGLVHIGVPYSSPRREMVRQARTSKASRRR